MCFLAQYISCWPTLICVCVWCKLNIELKTEVNLAKAHLSGCLCVFVCNSNVPESKHKSKAKEIWSEKKLVKCWRRKKKARRKSIDAENDDEAKKKTYSIKKWNQFSHWKRNVVPSLWVAIGTFHFSITLVPVQAADVVFTFVSLLIMHINF